MLFWNSHIASIQSPIWRAAHHHAQCCRWSACERSTHHTLISDHTYCELVDNPVSYSNHDRCSAHHHGLLGRPTQAERCEFLPLRSAVHHRVPEADYFTAVLFLRAIYLTYEHVSYYMLLCMVGSTIRLQSIAVLHAVRATWSDGVNLEYVVNGRCQHQCSDG